MRYPDYAAANAEGPDLRSTVMKSFAVTSPLVATAIFAHASIEGRFCATPPFSINLVTCETDNPV